MGHGLHATCHMAPAPCPVPHGQIARNSACKMHKISFYFAHNLLSTRGSQRCVRQCVFVRVCVCASVSLPVLPGPGSGHTFCRRCERLFRCAWLLFCEPFFPCLRLRCCLRTLSPFAVAVAISPLFGSNLDTFVMAAAAQAAETTTWPCHGQLAMFHTHTRLAKHFIIAFLN